VDHIVYCFEKHYELLQKGLLYASFEEAAGHVISHEMFNGVDLDIDNHLNIGYFDIKGYSFNIDFFNFVNRKYGSDRNAVGVIFGKESAKDGVDIVFNEPVRISYGIPVDDIKVLFFEHEVIGGDEYGFDVERFRVVI